MTENKLVGELSRYGDVWAYSRWHEDSELFLYGVRICPWWGKRRVESVRFRPADETYRGGGEVTVFYRRPLQSLGPYPSRTKHLAAGRHFAEVLRELVGGAP